MDIIQRCPVKPLHMNNKIHPRFRHHRETEKLGTVKIMLDILGR